MNHPKPRYPRLHPASPRHRLPGSQHLARGDTKDTTQHSDPTLGAANSAPLRILTLTGSPDRTHRRTTAATQNTHGSPAAGTSHPQAGSPRHAHRQCNTAYTSHPNGSLYITLSHHNTATNPQILRQLRAAHTRPSPTGPYTLDWATQPSDAVTDCDNLKSLGTWRVPERPGLARAPAPQDRKPEVDTPKPRALTPPDPPSASPQDQPGKRRTT